MRLFIINQYSCPYDYFLTNLSLNLRAYVRGGVLRFIGLRFNFKKSTFETLYSSDNLDFDASVRIVFIQLLYHQFLWMKPTFTEVLF